MPGLEPTAGPPRLLPLASWSEWLLHEIFDDEEGDARPVTTILVDDELLARALARGGFEIDPGAARELFLSSFPGRDTIQSWCSGHDPGSALVAFLVLCCFAASEAADSDLNNYRHRLREIMSWSEEVHDCGGLPKHWRRLARAVAAGARQGRFRPLALPDPRHRTQIGHAIELTFPSRADTRKLHHDLAASGEWDVEDAGAVIRWLGAYVGSDRFSRSFGETFEEFQDAWRQGERALLDHRFWTGWKVVIAGRRDSGPGDAPFEVGPDEWGDYQIIDRETGEIFHLTAGGNQARLPIPLRRAIADAKPVLLVEGGWTRWRWAGDGATAAQDAMAALIYCRAYSASRLEAYNPLEVRGAGGWAFTRAVDLLLTSDQRHPRAHGQLLDLVISGPPRVDGGRLGRPAFPVRLSARGPAARLLLEGEARDQVELTQLGPLEWQARPRAPLTAELRLRLIPTMGSGEVSRSLRLRRAAVAPLIGGPVSPSFVPDEPTIPPNWEPTTDRPQGHFGEWAPSGAETPRPQLRDLIEYLVARSRVLSLGEAIELIKELAGNDAWTVLRGLLDANVLRPLRVRGWNGRAVAPVAPSAVLRRGQETWTLLTEGLVGESLATRLLGRASQEGVRSEVRPGISGWSVETLILEAADREPLERLARELGLAVSYLRADLGGLEALDQLAPRESGDTHRERRFLPLDLAEQGTRLPLWLCASTRGDSRKLWATGRRQAERFWSDRYLAVLDAHKLAGAPAFSSAATRLVGSSSSTHLPIAVARWLRLATGVASGSTEGGYAYGLGASTLAALSPLLGDLLMRPEVSPDSEARRSPYRLAGAPLTGRDGLAPLWKIARHRGRHAARSASWT